MSPLAFFASLFRRAANPLGRNQHASAVSLLPGIQMSQEAASFTQTLASLIPSNQVLVVLAPEHSLSHALEVLHAAKITAAPVVKNGKAVGLVDLLDLVAYLAIVAKHTLRTSSDNTKAFKFAWGDSLDGLFAKNSSWSTAQVNEYAFHSFIALRA
jgi:hypothetical protein